MADWLTIVAGLPGSGKTSWAREQGALVVSSDVIREQRPDDTHAMVRERFFELVEHSLAGGWDVIADATNLAPHWRDPLYRIAQNAGARCRFVLFANVEQALERNAARDEPIPAESMRRMTARFHETLKLLPDELPRYDDMVIVMLRGVL